MGAENILFSLLYFGIRGEKPKDSLRDVLSADVLTEVYSLSKRYDLAGMTGQVLSELGILGEDSISQEFKRAAIGSVRRFVRMNYEYQCVCKALEEAGISFIPLKGAVIRNYYPEPWMRTSCDVDILVKEEALDDAVTVLAQKLNYKQTEKSSYDVSLFSPSGVHFELHYKLIEHTDSHDWDKPLENVWVGAVPAKGCACQYELADELFYYYHMVHMAKHFQAGGCGIRSVLDVWILNHQIVYDKTRRYSLLAEGGLGTFAKEMENLSEVWFSDAEPTELTKQIGSFILSGGAYGKQDRSIAIGQIQKGGKVKYMLHRVFLPYDALKYYYPVLQQHRWLLPVFEIVRWIKLLFGNGLKYWRLMMTNAVIKDEDRSFLADLLQCLELH